MYNKDVSCTADNVTPVSNIEKNIGTSLLVNEKSARLISAHTNLKCNLADVYDVDEATSMSATKPRISSMGDDNGDGKKKLLIPKLEK